MAFLLLIYSRNAIIFLSLFSLALLPPFHVTPSLFASCALLLFELEASGTLFSASLYAAELSRRAKFDSFAPNQRETTALLLSSDKKRIMRLISWDVIPLLSASATVSASYQCSVEMRKKKKGTR